MPINSHGEKEIKRIRKITEITEAVIKNAVEATSQGMIKLDVARIIKEEIVKREGRGV